MSVEKLRAKLDERADWLRYEYLHGGNFVHLSAREEECRYIRQLLDRYLPPETPPPPTEPGRGTLAADELDGEG